MEVSIPLANNKGFAVIDEEDYPLVSSYSWHIHKGHNTSYAGATPDKTQEKRGTILMHRLIAGSDYPKVDHRDGNGLNNKRGNLRKATHAQNLQNRPAPINGKSKYKGVCPASRSNRWIAQICANGTKVHLGTFDTEGEAATTYNNAAIEMHGEFAYINDLSEEGKAL